MWEMQCLNERGKENFIKLKVIYLHKLFCVLKHSCKALSEKEYTMQHIISFFISTVENHRHWRGSCLPNHKVGGWRGYLFTPNFLQ